MGFKVARERCNECLFSKSTIVSDSRRKQVLADCATEDAHFICHKYTLKELEGELSSDQANVCCKGFYDANPHATNLMRIAARLGVVEFVELPK